MDAWLDSLDPDPLVTVGEWFSEARGAELFEPEAAALATATLAGAPSVRMVLVRGLDARSLRFYTNRESRKAVELAANPRAALVFHWGPPLRRQVRVEGLVEQLGDHESLAYFAARERTSRLGAWASPQSRPLLDRDELDARYAAAEERFAGDEELPLPPFWGGYRLFPDVIELWQNRRSRLHDRVRYDLAEDGWSHVRLAP